MTAPITAVDIEQGRLNSVPPSPQGGWVLQQDFVAGHDGLSEIELILARKEEPQAGEDGRFTLTLLNAQDQVIAERSLLTQNFAHNHAYTLLFPAQRDSAGQRYRLQLSGDEANPLTVWGHDLNVYDDGQLTLVGEGAMKTSPTETAVQDLRFITRYQLTTPEAITTLGGQLWRDGFIILLALLFIPLPGVLLLRLRPLRWRHWDGMAKIGTALALGTAVWPLLWYAFSLIGGRWTGWLLWGLVVGGWLLVAGGKWQVASGKWQVASGKWQVASGKWASGQVASEQVTSSPHHLITSSPHHLITPSPHHLILLLILLAGLLVRLLAVRDLAAPPWVDAGRHALITAVMVENGRTLSDYAPYLPVDRFPYHFGFHTLSASLMLMTGWELERLLLVLGQLLNALTPLTVYTAVWLMSRRRGAALLAAFLVAIPFFFPAYYATWGRFTQLTAVLVMPVLLAFTWLLVRGAKRWRQGWWVVALLAAGVFLIHFRVFLFYVPFVAVLWLLSWRRHGRWLLLATLSTLLLVFPRILYLLNNTEPVKTLGYNLPNYNAFPFDYYTSGWDRFFIWLAGILLLIVFIAWLRRRSWAWLLFIFAVWVGLLFLLLAGDYLKLPSSSLVNLNSLYITLFFPLALVLGVGLDRLWRWLKQSHWILLLLGYVVAGMGLTAVTLFGLHQQIGILNPDTILVRPADLPALRWLAENLPAEANIAVNSWKWLGETWAGADGGAWIVPLTGRASTTPPADYIYSRALFDEVNAFNEAATAVSDWSAPETADWLQAQGITHLFIGARGGFLDPVALSRNPNMRMVYAKDGVFIFEIWR
jgi:hypothetical protein